MRAGVLSGYAMMLYSTRVQQRVCIQAHRGVPLRTTKRTLTWPYAGARVCVPVSGGKGPNPHAAATNDLWAAVINMVSLCN